MLCKSRPRSSPGWPEVRSGVERVCVRRRPEWRGKPAPAGGLHLAIAWTRVTRHAATRSAANCSGADAALAPPQTGHLEVLHDALHRWLSSSLAGPDATVTINHVKTLGPQWFRRLTDVRTKHLASPTQRLAKRAIWAATAFVPREVNLVLSSTSHLRLREADWLSCPHETVVFRKLHASSLGKDAFLGRRPSQRLCSCSSLSPSPSTHSGRAFTDCRIETNK